MSFRWRLALGIGLAVLITAAVYGALGYLSFRGSLEADLERRLEDFRSEVTAALDLGGERPGFKATPETRRLFEEYGDSRFRVTREGRIVLEFGGIFPGAALGWRTQAAALAGGYELELALNVGENGQALTSFVRTGLLVLPVALGVAIALSLLLQYLLLRPVRALRDATTELSRQAIPEPVAVPPGNDELSELARSFNRMTASLTAFLERERSFTRYASHELRTPLSNLRVLMEGLQRGILTPAGVWPQLEETISRMEGILSGLLTLTRSPKINPEPLPLELLLNEVVAGLSPTERSRVEVRMGASPIVLGQDDLIKQVLANLLGNALKYSDERVLVDLGESADSAVVTVRDYGPGVPEEALPKLTDPFFRLDSRKGGLGLGLALIRHIVRSMHGSLGLENASPGLAVTITLPLAEVPEGKAFRERVTEHA